MRVIVALALMAFGLTGLGLYSAQMSGLMAAIPNFSLPSSMTTMGSAPIPPKVAAPAVPVKPINPVSNVNPVSIVNAAAAPSAPAVSSTVVSLPAAIPVSATAAALPKPPAPAVPAQVATVQFGPFSVPNPALANAAPLMAAPAAAQTTPPVVLAQTTAAAPAPRAAPASDCANPNALGTSRVVQIDTTGGPGFGFEHFKQYDFLKDKEVVLTFDDGPWLNTTPAVLKALADQCVKATFFPIGKHTTYYPEILKQVADQGHTVGSHTWSHTPLTKLKTPEAQKEELEKGISAVKMVLGDKAQPFVRFPALQHPPEMVAYMGERNIALFSCDLDSFDFKTSKPELVVKNVMTKLAKHGKGIILMHDFQKSTAAALPELLRQLQAGGYKVVHMRAQVPVVSLAQYDDMVKKDQKLPTANARPVTDVVKTVE